MRLLLRSRHPWLITALFAGFWVAASIVPVEAVLLLTNSFVLFAAAGAAIRYLPIAWRVLRIRGSAAAQHVALGIVLASGFSAVWRIWSIMWLQGGKDGAFVNNDLVAFFQFAIAIGLCYHISVPNRDGRMPYWRVAFISGIVVASLALAGALIWTDPDTTWVVQAIIPWLPR